MKFREKYSKAKAKLKKYTDAILNHSPWHKIKENIAFWIKHRFPFRWNWLVYLYSKTIKIVLYTKNGSLTWPTRILILTFFGFIAVIFTPTAVEFIASRLIKNINILTQKNTIFSSSVTVLVFGFIFGFGYWIIRTHDVKKQFKDTFKQYNETLLSNAIDLLTQKDKHKAVGFRELTMLKNRNVIDHDRITGIIASLSFDGADLANIDLKELDLSGFNLENAKLQGAKLQGAKLQGANLQGVNFKNADLQGADLSGAKVGTLWRREHLIKHLPPNQTTYLVRTNFEKANLSYAQFFGVDISYVIQHGSGGNFSHTDLTGINLKKSTLKSIIFHKTTLKDADLRGARLIEPILTEADLRGADLREIFVGVINKQNPNIFPVYSLSDPKKELIAYIKTILKDAIYDNNTKFPDGFDPKKYEMKRK